MAKKILFVCVENAGRSQMAEAFVELHGGGRVEASSGGTMPSNTVDPSVVNVLLEKGIDISKNTPKRLTAKMVRDAGTVVVMGCEADGFCPAPLIEKVVDWEIEDPKGKSIEKVRQIRDEVEKEVLQLISEL